MTTPAPRTRTEPVVDVVHGREVADPYRWLESGDDPQVAAWVAEQNARTRQALDASPSRTWWHERLVALMRRPVVLSAQVRGPHLFCLERPAGAEQFLLTRRSSDDHASAAVVLLDPGASVDDAAFAIDWFEASDDGSLVAVGTSEAGSEDSVLRVLNARDGRDLGEAIPDTRACSVAWEPDHAGFVYTRYPAGDEYHRTVHHHRLGDNWADDPVVWAAHRRPEQWPDVELSPDGRHLLVHVEDGWARNDVYLLDRSTSEWTAVVEGEPSVSRFHVAAGGTSLVGVTTAGAPRGRVVEASLDATGPGEWTTLVAESDAVLGPLAVSTDELWLVTTANAVDTIRRVGPDGSDLGTVSGFGPAVAIAGLSADRTTGAAFAVVDAFDAPTTAWRLPRGPGAAVRWAPDVAEASGAALESLSVTQVSYPSLDGTGIGLFLLHRPDVTPGPDVPLILNGYGGFAISETPVWAPHVGAWCAAGGVYAIAGLRGGHEHGDDWHHAGRREHKQRVFDDFHAGADWLVSSGLASREHLAVFGRSNGGLLVGVAMTQRPDLCRAVWCGVPLLDMIRFPQFLIARLWTSEYGDPDVAEEFEWLHAYSPYHHVAAGTCYPATLFTTAEGDSRVDPLHARKMAAAVQAATSCPDDHPILLFQEARAGHGVGKPVHKRADELADGLTFLGDQLGLTPS